MPRKKVEVIETTTKETLSEDRDIVDVSTPQIGEAGRKGFVKGQQAGPGRPKDENVELKVHHEKAIQYLEELVLDPDYRHTIRKRMKAATLGKELELFMWQRVYGVPPTEQRTTKKVDASQMSNKQLSDLFENLKELREHESKVGSGIESGRSATA